MREIILKPRNADEFKLLDSLLKKLGVPHTSLKDEELEDFLLLKEMKKADRKKTVSKEEVLKVLKGK
ncbi:MAG: hypothetical protein ACK5B9_00455 [Flavobacteriia bacterium]|jgi:hypothetical protein